MNFICVGETSSINQSSIDTRLVVCRWLVSRGTCSFLKGTPAAWKCCQCTRCNSIWPGRVFQPRSCFAGWGKFESIWRPLAHLYPACWSRAWLVCTSWLSQVWQAHSVSKSNQWLENHWLHIRPCNLSLEAYSWVFHSLLAHHQRPKSKLGSMYVLYFDRVVLFSCFLCLSPLDDPTTLTVSQTLLGYLDRRVRWQMTFSTSTIISFLPHLWIQNQGKT